MEEGWQAAATPPGGSRASIAAGITAVNTQCGGTVSGATTAAMTATVSGGDSGLLSRGDHPHFCLPSHGWAVSKVQFGVTVASRD